jgi:MFS family permease
MTPTSASTSSPPAYKLDDPTSVILATLLGSPVAGTALMALNDHRSGRPRRALLILAIGVAVTALGFAFGSLIPSWAGTAVGVGLAMATMNAAKSLQGAALRNHVEKGGRLGFHWAASAMGVAFLAIVIVVAASVLLLVQRSPSKATLGSHGQIFASVNNSACPVANVFLPNNGDLATFKKIPAQELFM